MSFDINSVQISDEPLPELLDQWTPPSEFALPPPGQTWYNFRLSNIRSVAEYVTVNGKRIKADLDFEITSGPLVGKTVTIWGFHNSEFKMSDRGTTSFMLDMIKAAGYKGELKTNKDYAMALTMLETSRKIIRGYLDWEGICQTCKDGRLREITQSDSIESARAKATKDNWKEASTFSVKAMKYRDFPEVPNSGGKLRRNFFECPTCGSEIRARMKLNRWVEPKIMAEGGE